MENPFDPYYTWLGIPLDEPVPNHYRLLGLRDLEADPDVISNAADRQMQHVKSHQTGPHAAESQKLLNELAAARVCLLNVQRKADYDTALLASIPEQEGPPIPQDFPPQALPPIPLAAHPVPKRLNRSEGSQSRNRPSVV